MVTQYRSNNPPIRGSAWSCEISLYSQADVKLFQDNPTLAAGDIVVIQDGVLLGNITDLPVAVSGATRTLTVSLSAAEMTANRVVVRFHDAAGAEWCDAELFVDTVTADSVPDADDILNTALTETYAADGAAVTLAQALYEILQFHNERSISGSTITVAKRDGTTTAYTLTFDATSITRET